MTRDQILATLKTSRYDVVPGKTQSSIVLFTTEKDRVSFLKKVILSIFKSKGARYSTQTNPKSSQGGVIVGSVTILAKPKSASVAGRTISQLDARVFTKKGASEKFNYHGKPIDAKVFTSADILKKSILTGIRAEPLLGEPIAEMMEDFFTSKSFTWSKNIDMATRNKFGVYIGEVLIGYCILKGWRDMITPFPFSGAVRRFIIPTDPAFSGVDSFIEMANGTVYPISSKFGKGAKASLFSNLLVSGVAKHQTLESSKFKKLCEVAVVNNLKPTDSRAIVYTYGIRNILGLSATAFRNPNLLYEDIRTNKLSKESQAAIGQLKVEASRYNIPVKITGQFKQSNNWVSSYFNYVIAAQLNADKKSLSQMKKILVAKDYWQANMNIAQWSNGKVQFTLVNSGEATLMLDGAKSPATDIGSKQGWINYVLG